MLVVNVIERSELSKVSPSQMFLSLGSKVVCVEYPDALEQVLKSTYSDSLCDGAHYDEKITVEWVSNSLSDSFEIFDTLGNLTPEVGLWELPKALLQRIGRIGAQTYSAGLALEADLIAFEGHPVLVLETGAPGRTIATASLVDFSVPFIGSDWGLMDCESLSVAAPQKALILDEWCLANSGSFFGSFPSAKCEDAIAGVVMPALTHEVASSVPIQIFPHFEEGAGFTLSVIEPEEAAMRLSKCILNRGMLVSGGFDVAEKAANQAIALSIKFGAPEQLAKLREIIEVIVTDKVPPSTIRRMSKAFGGAESRSDTVVSVPPQATPLNKKRRLSIGMATYDDYDGVYFTIQSLRLHHADALTDAEYIVIDNNPTGRCAKALKALETVIPGYRYVPYHQSVGTAASRERIFAEAVGEIVMVLDCHVLLAQGSLHSLNEFFRCNPNSRDLIQGPMLQDDCISVYTHWEPVWDQGMLGTWAENPVWKKTTDPFDIPLQGLGLFACLRSAWPGFNEGFRGFGGEEGYIHEKFRQRGGRTLCLPDLKWLHRFARPTGVPYPIKWEDRIRNYLLGRYELDLSTDDVIEHFNEHVGSQVTKQVQERLSREMNIETETR